MEPLNLVERVGLRLIACAVRLPGSLLRLQREKNLSIAALSQQLSARFIEQRPLSKLGWMTPKDYAAALGAGRVAALRQGSAPRPLADDLNEGPNQQRTLAIAG